MLGLAFIVFIVALIAFGWWLEAMEVRRAHKWVASFHGERLPPAQTLRDKDHSMTFLLTVMPYYLEQDRRDERKKRERARVAPQPNCSKCAEPDCPECANGVSHEECRSGWLRDHQCLTRKGSDHVLLSSNRR